MPMINKEVEALIKPDEKGRMERPTSDDIKETIDLLSDFGIHTSIPEFQSRRQMYGWRRQEIKNKLARI